MHACAYVHTYGVYDKSVGRNTKFGFPHCCVCTASTHHTSDPYPSPCPVPQLQVRIQVARGEEKCPWSKDFSLDTVGYAGAIQIQLGGTMYHVRSPCCV